VTLKKINKDRNEKTTRTIQEGVLFSIDDVKRRMNDPKLLAAVSKQYNVSHIYFLYIMSL